MARWFAVFLTALSFSTSSALACSFIVREFPSDSKEIVEVKVGDSYFRFPESFFYYAEDRLPIERDYVRIRVTEPDFKALHLTSDIPETGNGWPKGTIYLSISEKDNAFARIHGSNVPVKLLGPNTQVQYGNSKVLTPDGVLEKLKPFTFAKPSASWDVNQKLAAALAIKKEHSTTNPCSGFDMRARDPNKKMPPPPAPPPLVDMKVIDQALAHKNQGFRQVAVSQLARYKDDLAALDKLKNVASSDSSYIVRQAAIFQIGNRKDRASASIPFLIKRLKTERHGLVIHEIGEWLNRQEDRSGAAALLMQDVARMHEPQLSEAIEVIGWSINDEVREKKLTKYEELSGQSKQALDLMMDYYERADANQDRKDRIRNALRNSKSAIASPRYVNEMLKQGAITELGDMAVEPNKTIPVLISELKSNRVANYPAAAEALGNFGPKAASALPYLLPILKFDCPREIGPNGEHIVRMEGLDDFKDPTKCRDFSIGRTRQVTANAIAQIGVASPEVLAALYESLGDDETAANAASALLKLDPDQEKLKKQMLYRLETSHGWKVPALIMSVLEREVPDATFAVPTLRKLMKQSPDMNTRRNAHRTLEKITGVKLPEPIAPTAEEVAAVQRSASETSAPPPVFTPPVVPPAPPSPKPAVVKEVKKEAKLTKPQIGTYGAIDTSVISHDAYEKKWEGKTNRKSGEFARYGAWDYGSCHGDDAWMCETSGTRKIGCEREFPSCSSGIAVASEFYDGDGECISTWWKWVCK